MILLYRLLALLVAPFALWRLQRPARRAKAFRGRWRERLGRVERTPAPVVWLHAASVGEVNAAQGLIRALLDRLGAERVLISTFTISGAERLEVMLGPDTVRHCFAPLDTRGAVRRWLRRIRPELAIVVETEIWPETFLQCREHHCPVVMVNARLTERSLHSMRRYRTLFAPALAAISRAACQTEADAERLASLGLDAERSVVTGNLKFDTPLPDDIGQRARTLREQWGPRPAWVAGSTRPGEEAAVLEAHCRLREAFPEALLILAPRHVERVAEVLGEVERFELRAQRIGETVAADTAVVVVDRIGELLACYAAAPAAFVGGSLVDIGGHNLLEPAAFGKAVLTGPYLYEQAESAHALREAGALFEVSTAEELADQVDKIWREPQQALAAGRAALAVVEAGRGSVRRTLRALQPWLPEPAAGRGGN